MWPLFFSGSLFLLADQWSKRIVQEPRFSSALWLGKVVGIRRVPHHNRFYGRAPARFGMVLLWLVALFSAIWLHSSGIWFQSPIALLGLGSALGGAAGNLTDIVRRQWILDFIDFGWWPAFNIADIGIIGGLLVAFCV